MGHMSNMAALCKFVAMRGLVKHETEEEKKERNERELAEIKRKEEIRKERNAYLAFWAEKYSEISDESAIINFEYALENVDKNWIHFIYGDSWAKDIKSALRYPDLHCEALMKTHSGVLRRHARQLQHEAFYGKGKCGGGGYAHPNEEHRIHCIGRVCNSWLCGYGWRGC